MHPNDNYIRLLALSFKLKSGSTMRRIDAAVEGRIALMHPP
jgi:hypothetical protein